MELIEGPTLADRIAPSPIPPEEALALARQVADALEAAHEKNDKGAGPSIIVVTHWFDEVKAKIPSGK